MSEPSPDRPLLIFDGDCAFCRAWVEYWKQVTGDRVDYAPYQEVGEHFPNITKEQFAARVQLVVPDGKVVTGAHAVVRLLALVPGKSCWLRLYETVPGLAPASEALYGLLARHRSFGYQVTKYLWGIPVQPETFGYASWIFL